MQIRLAEETDQAAWDAYVSNHPDGLAYQFFAWQKAVSAAYGYRHRYLLAESEGQICGLVPLIDFRIPFVGSQLVSLPYCDAGGVLADEESITIALIRHAENMADGCFLLRATAELLPGHKNRTDKVRMLLGLPDGSEALLSGMKAKLRSQVKKPTRDGLTAKIGGKELIDDFYPIFAENMRDLGSPVHSRRWIETIVGNYQQRVLLAVVYSPEGVAAAAGVVLLHPVTVSIPWASALRQFNRLNPNMLLYWTVLAYAADHGHQRFDFGRSTPGEGTYRFKEQWGAVPHPLFWYELPAKVDTVAETVSLPSPGRSFVTKLWQKLPVSAANILGPPLRKYISL